MILFYWLIWILPLSGHPLWGQKIGPLSVFESLGLLCLLYAVFRIFSRGKLPPVFSTWMTRFFFVVYLIAFFSALTKEHGISLADSSFIIYTSSMFLFVLTVSLVDTLARLRWIMLVIIGSYAWASVYLIREWQHGNSIWTNFRPGWIVGDGNYFSVAAIVAIVLAFCFVLGRRPLWEKAFCSACLLTTLVGVTLCASRGGFLGLAAACGLLAWRSKHRIRNFVLITVLVLPLSAALPVSPLHRFLHPTGSEKGSEERHWEAWTAGLRMIGAHPFAGVGLGNFKPAMPQYLDSGTAEYRSIAHNMFVEVAAELGLPAFLFFVAIFVSSFLELDRLRKSTAALPFLRGVAAALQAGVLGVAVAGSFVSAEYQKTTWMGLALTGCVLPLARGHRSIKAVRRRSPPTVANKDMPFEASNSSVSLIGEDARITAIQD